jgi:hypothetical protein
MDEERAAYRAGQPTLADAIRNCPRPDWALHIAFDEIEDRRAVLAAGATAARHATTSFLPGLFIPWPTPLEVVEVWALGKTSHDSGRGMLVPILFLFPIGLLVARNVRAPLGDTFGYIAIEIVVVLLALVGVRCSGLFMAWQLRRHAASLDEREARRRVFAAIAKLSRQRQHAPRLKQTFELVLRHALASPARPPPPDPDAPPTAGRGAAPAQGGDRR